MTYRVHVSRSDLAEALRTLAKIVTRTHQADAVLSFADGDLEIELPGGAIGVAAEGQWDGEVRVSGKGLLTYARSLPAADPMLVEVRGDRLHLPGFSTPCVVQDVSAARIQLPIDPSLLDILRMISRYSDEEIACSGLTPLVLEARRKFHQIGISGPDFDCFVEELLRQPAEERSA